MYNLASAAAATGANRSTILRAIKAGRLSAQRDAQGGWNVDPAELHRVFPPLPAAALGAQVTAQRDATDALVAELDHWRDAFQRQRRDAFQQLLLPMPEQPGAQAVPKDAGGPLYRVWARWTRKAGAARAPTDGQGAV